MNKQSQYEYLISYLQKQLAIAVAKEEELLGIMQGIVKKGDKRTAPSGAVITKITKDLEVDLKNASKKLEEYQLHVVGAIKSNIHKAKEILEIIERANYDIADVKFNFED